MTVNSFAAVSLDPPLVLWSPAKASRRYPAFAAADRYAIHVMGDDQHALCRAFVKPDGWFDGLDWDAGETGVPLLPGCLARFECTPTRASTRATIASSSAGSARALPRGRAADLFGRAVRALQRR